jgi:hypothetical protein
MECGGPENRAENADKVSVVMDGVRTVKAACEAVTSITTTKKQRSVEISRPISSRPLSLVEGADEQMLRAQADETRRLQSRHDGRVCVENK